MLFDLEKDEGETTSIAAREPEWHEDLYTEMMRYLEELGSRIPKKNPDYDPEVYQAQKEYEGRRKWGPFEGKRKLAENEVPVSKTP